MSQVLVAIAGAVALPLLGRLIWAEITAAFHEVL